MFRKPVRIKSNSQVKGCDRKGLLNNIIKSFPNLTESDLEILLPKKEVINSIKLVTASNETVQVYSIQKRPIVFDVRGTLFPTIYFLWKFPDLITSFATHRQVLSFLTSGADLMLPGVVTPPAHSGLSKYGNLQDGAIAYVNFSNNKAAIAVGITAQSSSDMLASGGRGKCLKIYHFHGDKLCTLEGMPNVPLADLGPPEWLKLTSYEQDFPELGVSRASTNTEAAVVESDVQDVEVAATVNIPQETEEASSVICTTEAMNELLYYCFFVAIKYSKTLTLPILTSNFYKLQMIPVCPDEKSLDLKKSSFKKLKPFLDAMCKDGVITVQEVKKGVESITVINKDHPQFTKFYIEPSLRPREEKKKGPTPSTSITESYIITQNVLPIFKGTSKGDTIQGSEIRRHVTEYVKKNNCQVEENKRLVKPKEALAKICKTENCITWEELMEKVCESMKSCYKVSSGTEEVVNKGKISPITLTVSQRSGNKKVTLIDNLELFGINITEIARVIKYAIAASTKITTLPGHKSAQLLVQGNQVSYLHKLLTATYKIPEKYIRGLENASK